jgi:hypothetical protein
MGIMDCEEDNEILTLVVSGNARFWVGKRLKGGTNPKSPLNYGALYSENGP